MSRLLLVAWAGASLATAGCGGAHGAAAPPPAPQSPAPERVSPPGAPAAERHATGRPEFVRLAPGAEAPSTLLVSSPQAGVVVAVDGEPERPLPLRLALPPGVHELRATCPDATSDIRRTILPAGATVRVAVCPEPGRP